MPLYDFVPSMEQYQHNPLLPSGSKHLPMVAMFDIRPQVTYPCSTPDLK